MEFRLSHWRRDVGDLTESGFESLPSARRDSRFSKSRWLETAMENIKAYVANAGEDKGSGFVCGSRR